MNFLSCCATKKASSTSLQISEIARSIRPRDDGFCGTSGITAAAGTGVWYVDPDPALREAAMANREKMGGYLQDRRWMTRVLDRTYDQSNSHIQHGMWTHPRDQSARYRKLVVDTTTYAYSGPQQQLFFNFDTWMLQDRRVRLAFAHAVDLKALLDVV
jgi:ABC-type transport system substrate-binding protein